MRTIIRLIFGNPLNTLLFQVIIGMLIPFTVLSQDQEFSTEKNTIKIYTSEYASKFKEIDDQKSFKKLREFLKQKQSLLTALNTKMVTLNDEDYAKDTLDINDLNENIKKFSGIIEGKKPNEIIEVRYGLLNPSPVFMPKNLRRNPDSLIKVNISELNDKISSFQKEVEIIRSEYEIRSNLEKSIDNVKDDIDKCSSQIDSALAPEYQQQDFRKIISISFSVLIGLLLSIFFFIVYKRSDNNLSKELLSGNGLQFITLFVLIIAVILFGILNILGSSELAAILSGISGYILGKGTQKDLSTAINQRDQQQTAHQPGAQQN